MDRPLFTICDFKSVLSILSAEGIDFKQNCKIGACSAWISKSLTRSMFVERMMNRSSVECILRGKEERYCGPGSRWIGYRKTGLKTLNTGNYEILSTKNMYAKD
jgi:hypothetical protein